MYMYYMYKTVELLINTFENRSLDLLMINPNQWKIDIQIEKLYTVLIKKHEDDVNNFFVIDYAVINSVQMNTGFYV